MSAFAIVVIVTCIAAVSNWYFRVRPSDRGELITKPLTTIGTIGIAALAGGPHGATIAAVIALVLCLIGDVALLPAVDKFVVGLASFLLGHIAFIVMFALRGFDLWAMAGVAVIGCAALVGTIAAPIIHGATVKGLGVPVRGYLVVITSMCVFGWATGNWLIMLGSAAFVISDSILGWGQFVAEKAWIHLAIMVTYHVAIISLALSLAI
jgi:alkenylglycerophosphocholine hydrolase